jgi:proton-dependent oligopeptide transporter, POT family
MASIRIERRHGGTGEWLLDKSFLSLALLEFWERFAMSGVKSLLVLILVDHVLAGDLTRVAGAAAFRTAVDALFGPLSVMGLASQLYGYINALIYLAIPLGGLMGDLLAGWRAMVVIGGMIMLLGLLLMTSFTGFLVGVLLFAAGTGLLKGNLSTQVGQLFRDEARRRSGYTAYLGFLNAGVICGPLVCGALAAAVGWTAAIGAAAAALMLGLACYWLGARGIASRPAAADQSPEQALPTMGAGWHRTLLILVALIAIYLCYSAYDQLGNIFLVWARSRVELHIDHWPLPVGWFLSLDGLFTLGLIFAAQIVFGVLERRGLRVGAMAQILLGGLCCAAGYLVLALGAAESGPMPLPWALLYLLLIDCSIVMIWPSGLSLIAGVAPRRLVGFWTGLFYLHGFFASLWVGLSGAYFGRVAPTPFWLLHAGVAGLGAMLALIVGLPLVHSLRLRQAITTSA